LVGVRKNSGPRELKPPLVFDAQLRLNNERDVSKGVFVDMPRGEVRIRKWSGQRGNTVVLPLSESATKWIKERVEEGGRLVFAMAWVGRSRRNRAVALYVALVFRRYAEQITPRRLLVIDLNALHNGVVWAVVEEGRVLRKGVLRPDVIKVLQLQQQIARLDALCAQRGAICRQANEAKSRLWRLLRQWEDEAAKKIIQLATQHKAAIIADVPDDESIRQLKEGNYSAEKKAMLNFGRLRSRIRELAEWHGVSYREERLYSTICPLCGGKMEEAPNRRVVCKCGFKAHRDEVPIHWAMKLFKELLTPLFFHYSNWNRDGNVTTAELILFKPPQEAETRGVAAAYAGRGPSARRLAKRALRHTPPQAPPGAPPRPPGARAPRGGEGAERGYSETA